MNLETTSTQCEILVMEAPLDPLVNALLVSAEVDSTMFVPSQFKLVFRGSPDDVLLPGGLQLATPVTVTASDDGVPMPLITGEITAVEVEYAHGETLTIVRGMDLSHRLMRGTNTMAYPEMTASDVVTMLVGEAGIIPGEIIPTTNIYPWLSQANVSNWVFIQQLAALENYVAYADALGLFNFCPMPMPEAGLPPAMSYDLRPWARSSSWARTWCGCGRWSPSAEQVEEVTATGYDPSLAVPVLGPWPSVPSSSQSIDPATLPPLVGGEFEATAVLRRQRPHRQRRHGHELGRLHRRRHRRRPGRAGGRVRRQSGPPGRREHHHRHGRTCPLTATTSAPRPATCSRPTAAATPPGSPVGGFRDRSLFALSSGATSTRRRIAPAFRGWSIGTVVDNEDPEEQGQVKVMFPWLSPDYISAWARVMQIGASKVGGGFLWIPEIGDEVLIGFDRGSIDHPVRDRQPLQRHRLAPARLPRSPASCANRRIASRMAHTIQWNDGPEAMGISIMTAPVESPPTSVVLDGEEIKITINSLGQVEITGALGVSISAEGGPLSLERPHHQHRQRRDRLGQRGRSHRSPSAARPRHRWRSEAPAPPRCQRQRGHRSASGAG